MENLTYEDAKRKTTFAVKKYLKDNGYNDVLFHCTRGVFHLTNGGSYFLSASNVIEKATGLKTLTLNSYMAKIDKNQFCRS